MSETSTYNDILLSNVVAEGILRLTLNDVSRRNALSNAMLGQLSAALSQASNTTSIRVIILGGNGPAFCAGHDLKELTKARQSPDKGRAEFASVMAACSSLMQAIVTCPKPVIAQVGGVATAAGCQLVASCDLAIASEQAKFSTPGVHIGLFCSTPMVALSRNIAPKHAMEMLLTGDMLSAHRAAEIGLINRVVKQDRLEETTLELARKIGSKSSATLAIGKRAYYAQNEMGLAQAYNYASKVMTDNLLAEDAEEGIDAFLKKREPNWHNT